MVINTLEVKIKLNVTHNLSFWQAIKIRIAGKNYKRVIDELIKQIKIKFNK